MPNVIRSETNIGFAAGVNEAFRRTSAGYVALINNDVVLDRDWLAATKQVLDIDDKAAAVQTIIRRDARASGEFEPEREYRGHSAVLLGVVWMLLGAVFMAYPHLMR